MKLEKNNPKMLFLLTITVIFSGCVTIHEIPIQAVMENDVPKVNKAIKSGADVDIRYESGYTPIMVAAIYNSVDVAKVLLENCANINARSGGIEQSALIMAAAYNHIDMVRLLLENGANVNAEDNTKMKAWHIASYKGNDKMLELLKSYEFKEKDNKPVIELGYIKQNDLLKVKELIEAGADVNIRDSDGKSLLHWAAYWDVVEVAELLVGKGADVNILDKSNSPPLMSAAIKDSFRVAKLLIEKGAKLDIKSKNKHTPLMIAANWNSVDVLKLLLENGADINARGIFDRTPLCYAVDNNSVDSAEVLIKAGAKTDLSDSIFVDSYEKAQLLNWTKMTELLTKYGVTEEKIERYRDKK
ncbi:MAG: ankyrin repeat domain-containing protein [Elusimicrobia bacterium]|nr:ankyrin repeat domain-containing protein [Elusimicrobiota bacterium]